MQECVSETYDCDISAVTEVENNPAKAQAIILFRAYLQRLYGSCSCTGRVRRDKTSSLFASDSCGSSISSSSVSTQLANDSCAVAIAERSSIVDSC